RRQRARRVHRRDLHDGRADRDHSPDRDRRGESGEVRMSPEPIRRPGELTRTFLQLLTLGALLVTSLWIVRPFLIAGLWAVMLAVATWPLLLHAQRLLGGRRALATALLTLFLLLILVIPLYLGISAVVESADDIATLTQSLANWSVPQPPDWV